MFVCQTKSGLMLMLTEPLFPLFNKGKAEDITVEFSNFLNSRAENGFTLKDRVKYSYIEFTQAKGFWSTTRAFIKSYGTVGRFFIQNEDLTELQKQTQFYQEIGKVQSIFLKFQWQLSNPWWYYGLSQSTAMDALEAFEKLMLSYEGNDYRNVHKIFNQGIGKALETIIAGMINRHLSSNEGRENEPTLENFAPINEKELETLQWDESLKLYKQWHKQKAGLLDLYWSARNEEKTDETDKCQKDLLNWDNNKPSLFFENGITVNGVLRLPLLLPPDKFHFR
jgi:hypothetical protein